MANHLLDRLLSSSSPHFCTLRLARRQPINISGKYLSLPSVVLLHLFCPFRDGRDDSQEGLNRTRKCKLVTHCHRRNFFMNCSCQRRAVAVGRERHAFVNWPLFLISPHLSGELRSYPLVKLPHALLSAWIRHIADKKIFKSCRHFAPFPPAVFPHGDLISIYFTPRKSTRSAHYVPSFLSHRHSRHASLRAPSVRVVRPSGVGGAGADAHATTTPPLLPPPRRWARAPSVCPPRPPLSALLFTRPFMRRSRNECARRKATQKGREKLQLCCWQRRSDLGRTSTSTNERLFVFSPLTARTTVTVRPTKHTSRGL